MMEHHGAFAVKPPVRIPPELQLRHAGVVFHGRLSTTDQRYDSTLYVVRVESADTGEVRDIQLSMSVNDVPPRVIETSETVPGQTTTSNFPVATIAPGSLPTGPAPASFPAAPASSRVL